MDLILLFENCSSAKINCRCPQIVSGWSSFSSASLSISPFNVLSFSTPDVMVLELASPEKSFLCRCCISSTSSLFSYGIVQFYHSFTKYNESFQPIIAAVKWIPVLLVDINLIQLQSTWKRKLCMCALFDPLRIPQIMSIMFSNKKYVCVCANTILRYYLSFFIALRMNYTKGRISQSRQFKWSQTLSIRSKYITYLKCIN